MIGPKRTGGRMAGRGLLSPGPVIAALPAGASAGTPAAILAATLARALVAVLTTMLAVVLAADFVAAAGTTRSLYLEVALYSDGSTVFSRRVSPGDRFAIHFVHSVMKTPVSEVFKVDDSGAFELVESIYYSFGAGLPSEEIDGQEIVLEDGHLRVTGFHRSFRELLLAVGWVAQHQLTVGQETVTLASIVAPGTPVVIRIKGGAPS